MSKRSVFTSITPLPPQVTRSTVLETLHSHTEMIDLNPLIEERHIIKPPEHASAEEYHCIWYEMTDRVSFIPGLVKGKVHYTGCFHDLANGLQTHCYAAAGVDIKGKWTLGGSLPGEPSQPVEIGQGIPMSGLYLREDVDMRCNVLLLSFVRKTLKNAHKALVGRLLVKTQLAEAATQNDRLSESAFPSSRSSPHMSLGSPGFPSPNAFALPNERGRAQSPYGPGRMSYQQSRDPSLSQQYPSPGFQMDPAYQNASFFHHQQKQPPMQQLRSSEQSFQPSEMDTSEGSGYQNGLHDQRDSSSHFSQVSPPPVATVPVELDATATRR